MIKVGVIGAGYWGKNIVRTFYGIESVILKYICDDNTKTLGKFTQYPDVKKTIDYHDVIEDNEIDAVVVSTLPATHYEIARAALEAGKHVMVEKPMTFSVDHARELVDIAETAALKLMVGHLMMYHPCIEALKSYIGDGEMGDVYYLYCQRLNLGKVRSDENALQSFAPHDISIANHLIGETPVTASACGHDYLRKNVEDVVFLNLLYPGGRMANIHVSWLDPHKIRRTTVVGSKKMAVFDDMEPREKIRIYDKGVDIPADYVSYSEFLSLRDGNISIPAIKMNEPLRCECEHFIDCIVNDRTPKSDGRNGLEVTKVLDAAQRSLKNGGHPVDIVV